MAQALKQAVFATVGVVTVLRTAEIVVYEDAITFDRDLNDRLASTAFVAKLGKNEDG